MTISSTVISSSVSANGSTTNFVVGFAFISTADVEVYLNNVKQTSGFNLIKISTVDYVSFTVAPVTGTVVSIRRKTPLTQATAYVNNDSFPAKAHESALDKLTMIVQESQYNILNATAADVAASAANVVLSASNAALAALYAPAYFSTRAAMLANTTVWALGQLLNTRKEDAVYEVAAPSVVDHDEVTASGNKLYLVSTNVIVVRTRIALGTLVTGVQKTAALAEVPRQGTFEWQAGDYTTKITNDPGQGVYVQHATVAANLGAWVRRTDQALSPRMFGAANDTTTVSQHVALNRFFAAIRDEYYPWVDWGGSFYTTDGLVFGSPTLPILSKNIKGRMVVRTITGGAPETAARLANPTMFKLDGSGGSAELKLGDISLYGIGSESGGATYATRDNGFHTGFQCYSSARLNMERLRVQNVSGFAFNQWASSGPNNNANTIGALIPKDCGSGYSSVSYVGNLTATFSNRVDAGASASFAQTTTFDVTALPPVAFDAATSGAIQPAYVYFNNTMHLISSIDRVNGRITLVGWADLRTTTGTLAYVMGGGLLAMGGDSGTVHVGLIDAVRCGISLSDAALYGAIVDLNETQSVGISWAKGSSLGGSTVGGRVGGYFEGNLVDLMVLPSSGSRNQNGQLTDEYALGYRKIQKIIYRTSANGVGSFITPAETVVITRRGVQMLPEGFAQNNRDVGSVYGIDLSDRNRLPVFRKATQTVVITKMEDGLNALIGADSYLWVSIGTAAAGGAPTSVTVNVPAASTAVFTVNATTDVMTATAPYLLRGSRVQFTTTTTLPAPLALATDYWVVPQEDGVTYKLATSLANANVGTAGTTIDLTDTGTGVHTLTHMLTLNGGVVPVVFNALTGPTVFALSQQVLTNDFIVCPLSPTGTTGSTAMTGTALAGALLAYAKAADVPAPTAAPADYVPGADVPAASAGYVQAEANAVITRLNAATATIDIDNASLRTLISEVATLVTRFNTLELGQQNTAQKLKRHDDILFTANIAKV